jgi:hypothetical protein
MSLVPPERYRAPASAPGPALIGHAAARKSKSCWASPNPPRVLDVVTNQQARVSSAEMDPHDAAMVVVSAGRSRRCPSNACSCRAHSLVISIVVLESPIWLDASGCRRAREPWGHLRPSSGSPAPPACVEWRHLRVRSRGLGGVRCPGRSRHGLRPPGPSDRPRLRATRRVHRSVRRSVRAKASTRPPLAATRARGWSHLGSRDGPPGVSPGRRTALVRGMPRPGGMSVAWA